MTVIERLCAVLAIAIGAHAVYGCAVSKKAPAEEAYCENNTPFSGMFFTSSSVVEEYEYDDAYCLLYTDADANMFDVEICVDLETFQAVREAVSTGRHIVGALVMSEDYCVDGAEVYTYMSEPEYEMALESAR